MSRALGTTIIACGLVTANLVAQQQSDTSWSFQQILDRVRERIVVEDHTVEAAESRLAFLDALGKTRVELLPQLSLLSFSNPFLFATNLGSSFSVNRRTAPSPVDLELASVAVVDAEMGLTRRVLSAEIDATQLYFKLAGARDATARSCEIWRRRTQDESRMQTLVSLNKATRMDAIRFAQDVNLLESDCVEAKAQERSAAMRLISLLDARTAPEQLILHQSDVDAVPVADNLPVATDLLEKAFGSHSELKAVSRHITELTQSKRISGPRVRFQSMNLGYSYLSNKSGSYAPVGKQWLLGGNVGSFNVNFSIPLRKIGDVQAARAFMQARYKQLNHEFGDLKTFLNTRLEEYREQSLLSAARFRLAKRKAQLADELRVITIERRKAGLDNSNDELWAERNALLAESEAAHKIFELQGAAYTVLALSGSSVPTLRAAVLLGPPIDSNKAYTAKSVSANFDPKLETGKLQTAARGSNRTPYLPVPAAKLLSADIVPVALR